MYKVYTVQNQSLNLPPKFTFHRILKPSYKNLDLCPIKSCEQLFGGELGHSRPKKICDLNMLAQTNIILNLDQKTFLLRKNSFLKGISSINFKIKEYKKTGLGNCAVETCKPHGNRFRIGWMPQSVYITAFQVIVIYRIVLQTAFRGYKNEK